MLLNRSPPDDDLNVPEDTAIMLDEEAIDLQMFHIGEIIENHESHINPDQKLHLFTFSPDPNELPDADFQCQHEFAMMFVVDFLRGCRVGLACVEANINGRPHYHGWFQTSDDANVEMRRIVAVKLMQKYAPRGLKFTEGKRFRVNSYTQHGNCLYYYKKDVFGPMMNVIHNVITRYTVCDIDWEQRAWWFDMPGNKTTSTELIKKMSDRKYFEDFYRNSDPVRGNGRPDKSTLRKYPKEI